MPTRLLVPQRPSELSPNARRVTRVMLPPNAGYIDPVGGHGDGGVKGSIRFHGPMHGTGSPNRMQGPRSLFVAQVRPWSARERCAGPAVLG